MKKYISIIATIVMVLHLSGCVAVSVVSTAVGATVAVVEGAVEVVDAVTPDIFSDDDDDDDNENNEDDEDE